MFNMFQSTPKLDKSVGDERHNWVYVLHFDLYN